MEEALIYHYPPDLLELLIETIPLLIRSKPAQVDFFRGAGVKEQHLRDLRAEIARDRTAISRYKIARTVLVRINEGGDPTLRERREVLKRVAEFEEFSLCWPKEQQKARGLVAQIREIVGKKDAFTRMKQERDAERRQRMEEVEARLDEKRRIRVALEQARSKFYRLFGETDAAKRGRLLEPVMSELLTVSGIQIREPFTLSGPGDRGIVEQVDGVIELDSRYFLVEIKWLAGNLGKEDASLHLVRVYHRPSGHGLFISATPFTEGALTVCTEALQKERIIVLCTLQEIFSVLEMGRDLRAFFRAKVEAVIAEKNPFPRVLV